MVSLYVLTILKFGHSLVLECLCAAVVGARLHSDFLLSADCVNLHMSAEDCLRHCNVSVSQNVTLVSLEIGMLANAHLDHEVAGCSVLGPVATACHSQIDIFHNALRHIDILSNCGADDASAAAIETGLLVLALSVASIALFLRDHLVVVLNDDSAAIALATLNFLRVGSGPLALAALTHGMFLDFD